MEREDVPNIAFFSLFLFCLKYAMCQVMIGFILNFEKWERIVGSVGALPSSTLIIIIIHFNFVLLLELGI